MQSSQNLVFILHREYSGDQVEDDGSWYGNRLQNISVGSMNAGVQKAVQSLQKSVQLSTSVNPDRSVGGIKNDPTFLEKTLSDCNCPGTSVSLTLTQEDTLKLQQQPRSQAEIQIRVRTTAGEALASDIMSVYVGRILKEGVI